LRQRDSLINIGIFPATSYNFLKFKTPLSGHKSKGNPMSALSRIGFVTLTTVGSFFVLSSLGLPASAEDLPQNLGPVGPDEPIMTEVGAKRVIAWYEPDSDGCAVTAVAWNRSDAGGSSAQGVRIRLGRGRIVHLASAYNIKTLNLRCGDNAATLSIVKDDEHMAFGDTQQPDHP
jgi:hypothetical protein